MGLPIVIVANGGLPVTESPLGIGVPVSIASNGFGIAVTIVSSGGIAVVGTGAAAGPTTPVLSLLSVVASAVSLAIDVDNTVVAGDTVTLQAQVSGGNWSSLLVNTAHVITSGEDGANEIDLTPAGFASGSYDFRAKVNHVTDSAWSNTVTATVSVSSFVPTFYFLGF